MKAAYTTYKSRKTVIQATILVTIQIPNSERVCGRQAAQGVATPSSETDADIRVNPIVTILRPWANAHFLLIGNVKYLIIILEQSTFLVENGCSKDNVNQTILF